MTCENYNYKSGGGSKDVSLGLSASEQKLLDKFTKVSVVGKRGRPVPVLLTSVVQKHAVGSADENENCCRNSTFK
jgi:hypothetical protein